MHYFSRLTDIVTVSLSSLLNQADDKSAAIEQIVTEIEEGLEGSKRSVITTRRNEQRLLDELAELSRQMTDWTEHARTALSAGNESEARSALSRKQEVGDLVAGLEQQLQAAIATREQLETTQRALQARLAEAKRRREELRGEAEGHADAQSNAEPCHDRVEAELEALRRELGE